MLAQDFSYVPVTWALGQWQTCKFPAQDELSLHFVQEIKLFETIAIVVNTLHHNYSLNSFYLSTVPFSYTG